MCSNLPLLLVNLDNTLYRVVFTSGSASPHFASPLTTTLQLSNLGLHFPSSVPGQSHSYPAVADSMARGDTRARTGLPTFLLASSALVWISAVIVMGILAYLVSRGWGGDHVIYELVIVSSVSKYLYPTVVGTARADLMARTSRS